jgi:uncharacterized protein involved in exopolysaccharide biosynthesis
MNLRSLIYLLCLRKWLIIIPPFITCTLALGVLIFVEPIYTSSIKLWNKEMKEDSSILKVVRSDSQKDLYANVQREIIRSGAVLEKVLEEQKLTTPPPSNNMASKIFNFTKIVKKTMNEEQKKIAALTALQKSITVDVINPEIILISAQMNSPKLALEVVKSVAENYKAAYFNILNKEINQYEEVLQERLNVLLNSLSTAEKALQDFESQNPDTIRKPQFQTRFTKLPNQAAQSLNVKTPLPSMSSDMSQVNSLTLVIHELSKLELKKSKTLTEVSSNSALLKTLNEEIEQTKSLLKISMQKLSLQAKLAVQYQRLQWKVNLSRERYTALLSEFDKITLSRGTKMQQISSISVLDEAVEPLYPIYPKKKMIVIAAGFLGILTGLACAYLAQILDPSFYLEDEITEELNLPVIAVIPFLVGDNK